ncbi:cytochrome c peroxidase [Vararia minispora EC-137]|uniref:Cytochrome c peroxidase n=1 Tax=Vararia minispora EC-137 TaxID=1314806 RepID=A0ACB8QZF1_9AGAM|nr:cytochrome c peroxidase [Vararia minispora EC-137]
MQALRASARRAVLRAAGPRSLSLRNPAFRRFTTEAPKPEAPKSSNTALFAGLGVVALAGAGYFFFSSDSAETTAKKGAQAVKVAANFVPAKEDYQKVYNAIADKLEKDPEYDDGSYGPVILRLAWHASGTYDKETGTGGSNYATMRFAPESLHGANAGLHLARTYMEEIKEQFPWISYGDLWTLGGVAAIQEMGGPTVHWRPGRIDGTADNVTPDGRLPDATQGPKHLRDIFYRMGFNDQEIVALSGAHALGRCHTDRSGFDGPWTFSPVTISNEYYRLLLDEKWVWRKWDGPKQLQDKTTKSLMMLPTDYSLVQDKAFKPWVKAYAADEQLFFQDFAKVIETLFELGVPRAQFVSSEGWAMKRKEDQEPEKK